MIPWLFSDGNYSTPPSVTSVLNAQKEMTDTISCVVDQELNGMYELTMQYPISGTLYEDIGIRSILYVNPNEYTDRQMFRIYKITKPLNGIVTIYARHIAYDLAGIICQPFTASGIQAALSGIISNAIPSNYFTFSTTRTTASAFTVTKPTAVWSLMAGQEGSLLDVYGGEYDFDNYSITLENSVGSDNGVTIEYGKNITALKQDEDGSSMASAIFPYYYTDENGLVTLTEKILSISGAPFSSYKAVDLSDKFLTGAPTEAELRTAGQAYLDANVTWQPKLYLDAEFVPLWQTQEYNGDAREVVHLGDTVTIRYAALGVSATARAMAYRYNCLNERYEKITIGSVKPDLSAAIRQIIGRTVYDNGEYYD